MKSNKTPITLVFFVAISRPRDPFPPLKTGSNSPSLRCAPTSRNGGELPATDHGEPVGATNEVLLIFWYYIYIYIFSKLIFVKYVFELRLLYIYIYLLYIYCCICLSWYHEIYLFCLDRIPPLPVTRCSKGDWRCIQGLPSVGLSAANGKYVLKQGLKQSDSDAIESEVCA